MIYSDLWYSVRKCYSTISVHLHICILNELDNMRYIPPQHLLDHQLWSFIFTTKPFQDSSVYHECNIYHICIYLSIALYISWYITGGITLLYHLICMAIYIRSFTFRSFNIYLNCLLTKVYGLSHYSCIVYKYSHLSTANDWRQHFTY